MIVRMDDSAARGLAVRRFRKLRVSCSPGWGWHDGNSAIFLSRCCWLDSDQDKYLVSVCPLSLLCFAVMYGGWVTDFWGRSQASRWWCKMCQIWWKFSGWREHKAPDKRDSADSSSSSSSSSSSLRERISWKCRLNANAWSDACVALCSDELKESSLVGMHTWMMLCSAFSFLI